MMVLDHAVVVVCDESFASRDEAVEEIVDRIESCMDVDQVGTDRSH